MEKLSEVKNATFFSVETLTTQYGRKNSIVKLVLETLTSFEEECRTKLRHYFFNTKIMNQYFQSLLRAVLKLCKIPSPVRDHRRGQSGFLSF